MDSESHEPEARATTVDSESHEPETLATIMDSESHEPETVASTDPSVSDPLTDGFRSLNDLAHDLDSLHDLATRGSWRVVLDKVARARSLSVLTKPHDSLTYLTFQVLAFTKLRRSAEASQVLDSLHDFDGPHYRYESYPEMYPGRSGSMVPFTLRWLYALIPMKLGNRQEGLDRFYILLDFVRGRISEKESRNLDVSLIVWRKREVFVMNCLLGYHLGHKEFSVCLDLIRDLIKRDPLDAVSISRLGYLQMQFGDLEGAKSTFNGVEGMLNEGKSNGLLSEVEFKNLVNRNKALVYSVGNDYVSAVREYEECIERDPTDVVAVNNKALCLMYLRDLPDAIKVLENGLERVPTVALNETLVVNLCSMYELAYVNHTDIKKTLSNWIARVAPDDFDSSCTRV